MVVELINVEDKYFNLSPWFFPQLYPGHLGFWPMRKINTVMFTKYKADFLSIQSIAGPLKSSGTSFLVSIRNVKTLLTFLMGKRDI